MSSVVNQKNRGCSFCGKELEPRRASYISVYRPLCNSCERTRQIKEKWKPMSGKASISAIYTINKKIDETIDTD